MSKKNKNLKKESSQKVLDTKEATLVSNKLCRFTTTILAAILIIVPIITSQYFQDHFTVTKWHAVIVLTFVSAVSMLFYKKIYFPHLPKGIFFSVATLFFVGLVNVFYLRRHDFHWPLLDRLTFILLVFMSYQVLKDNLKRINIFLISIFIATVAVHIYSIFQIFGIELYPYIAGKKVSSFFGNANMCAQFLGISLIAQFYFFFQEYDFVQKLKLKWPLIVLMAYTNSYLYYLACRSVVVALILSIGTVLILFPISKIKKDLVLILASSILMGILINQVKPDEINFVTKVQNEIYSSGTDNVNSLNLRITLWRGAWKMFLDYPMGIGSGNFEFFLVPYQVGSEVPPDERLVYNTPHNEFFRFLTEDGLIYTAALILFFILLTLKFYQVKKNKTVANHHWHFLVSYFIYYAVEGFFQFPLMNAFPFVFFTIILSYTCIVLYESGEINWDRPKKIGFSILLVLYGYLEFNSIYATFTEANLNNDIEKLTYACEHFPARWRSCVFKAKHHLDRGDFAEAQQVLIPLLERSPYNFVGMRLLAGTYFEIKNHGKACFHLWQFDRLFENKSTLHKQLVQFCPKQVLDRFEKEYTRK